MQAQPVFAAPPVMMVASACNHIWSNKVRGIGWILCIIGLFFLFPFNFLFLMMKEKWLQNCLSDLWNVASNYAPTICVFNIIEYGDLEVYQERGLQITTSMTSADEWREKILNPLASLLSDQPGSVLATQHRRHRYVRQKVEFVDEAFKE